MREELKPCPFCGGDAYLSDFECGKDGMPINYRNPRCKRCGASLGYAALDNAITLWNHRVPVADGRGEGVEAREQIAVQYLARIFAAQRLREDGSYAGWKIAGKGS